jgi:hypothetical protein
VGTKIPLLVVAALIIADASQAYAAMNIRKDCATRAYWPTFGYIPGGPYVYVPPMLGQCQSIRRAEKSGQSHLELSARNKPPIHH